MDSAKQENIKKSMKVNDTKGKSCFSLSLTPKDKGRISS